MGGFSLGFRQRNADTLRRIGSGPTPGEVRSARPDGLGLSQGPAASDPSVLERGLGIAADVGRAGARIVGGVASLGVSEAIRAKVMQANEMRARQAQADQAQIRAVNLENLTRGLNFTLGLAQQIAQIKDPEAREAVRQQAESAVTDQVPQFMGVFRSAVDNSALAFMDQERRVADLLARSPTFSSFAAANPDLDFSKMPDDAIEQGLDEHNRSVARDAIPAAETKLRSLRKQAADRFPGEFPDEGQWTTDQAEALVARLADEDPDLADPKKRGEIISAFREFPERFNLEPSELVRERLEKTRDREEKLDFEVRKAFGQESAKARFREPGKNEDVNLKIPSEGGRVVSGRVLPNGRRQMLNEATGEFEDAPADAVVFGTSGTPGEVLPDRETAAAGALSDAGTIAEASSLLDQLDRGGAGLTGIRAAATEHIAGAIAQVNESLGEVTAKGISGGNSLAQVQQFQTRARAVVAKSIPQIAGEESGRYTEAERQITERATALVDVGKSLPQVRSGLQALVELSIVSQDKRIVESGGTPPPLETDDQLRAELVRYRDNLGLPEDRAVETLNNVLKQREELGRVLRSLQQQGQ